MCYMYTGDNTSGKLFNVNNFWYKKLFITIFIRDIAWIIIFSLVYSPLFSSIFLDICFCLFRGSLAAGFTWYLHARIVFGLLFIDWLGAFIHIYYEETKLKLNLKSILMCLLGRRPSDRGSSLACPRFVYFLAHSCTVKPVSAVAAASQPAADRRCVPKN